MAGPKRSPIYQDPATAEFDAILKANGNAYEVAALRRAQRTNPLSSASTTSSPQITPGSEIAGLATTPTTNRTMSSPTAASQTRLHSPVTSASTTKGQQKQMASQSESSKQPNVSLDEAEFEDLPSKMASLRLYGGSNDTPHSSDAGANLPPSALPFTLRSSSLGRSSAADHGINKATAPPSSSILSGPSPQPLSSQQSGTENKASTSAMSTPKDSVFAGDLMTSKYAQESSARPAAKLQSTVGLFAERPSQPSRLFDITNQSKAQAPFRFGVPIRSSASRKAREQMYGSSTVSRMPSASQRAFNLQPTSNPQLAPTPQSVLNPGGLKKQHAIESKVVATRSDQQAPTTPSTTPLFSEPVTSTHQQNAQLGHWSHNTDLVPAEGSHEGKFNRLTKRELKQAAESQKKMDYPEESYFHAHQTWTFGTDPYKAKKNRDDAVDKAKAGGKQIKRVVKEDKVISVQPDKHPENVPVTSTAIVDPNKDERINLSDTLAKTSEQEACKDKQEKLDALKHEHRRKMDALESELAADIKKKITQLEEEQSKARHEREMSLKAELESKLEIFKQEQIEDHDKHLASWLAENSSTRQALVAKQQSEWDATSNDLDDVYKLMKQRRQAGIEAYTYQHIPEEETVKEKKTLSPNVEHRKPNDDVKVVEQVPSVLPAPDFQSGHKASAIPSLSSTPERTTRPQIPTRRVKLMNLPPGCSAKLVATLIWGGKIESIDYADGSKTASVLFLLPEGCAKYLATAGNRIKYQSGEGSPVYWVHVEACENTDLMPSKLAEFDETDVTRCILIPNIEKDWTVKALTKVASRSSRSVEHIYTSDAQNGLRSAHFQFGTMQDAIDFAYESVRNLQFEESNILFSPDPCAKATGVHY